MPFHRKMSVKLHLNQFNCDATSGVSIFDHADRLGVRVPTSCRKQGKCKECVVEVTEGMGLLSGRTEPERHLSGRFRLSCCARVASESGTLRCHTMRRGTLRIERQAYELPVSGKGWKPEPAVTRDGDRILLDGEEIARSTAAIHGLAVDVGTTTVVLRLFDLETGEIIADSSFENPQLFGGSDVMARIAFDTADRTRTLQRTLTGYLSHAIEDLPVDPQTIYEVVLAGNSTMRDIFFRLSVYTIGQSPYQSITESELASGKRTTTSLTAAAKHLGLPIHPRARVYGLPIISGHLGADTAACMLAIDLAHEKELVAIMDIGTNTELILGTKDKIYAASCPAGPAFEGGDITFGMPGLPGAIEKVRIAADGGVHTSVIGGGPAEGICGSGMVDLLSELLRTEQMNALGRFEEAGDFVVDTHGPQTVTFSEADINALAQAKGANVAGLRIILQEYGVQATAIDRFYLAGGFGRHLNIDSAKHIGLIPDIGNSRIRQVGNASIEGAGIALLSRSKRDELEMLVRKAKHCRLETHPGFFDFFVEGCQFTPVGASLEALDL